MHPMIAAALALLLAPALAQNPAAPISRATLTATDGPTQ